MSIIDAYIGNNPVDEVYLGSQLIYGRYHPHTHSVLDEAQRQGFKKPLNINAFDAFIREFIALGFLEKFDTYYLFASDLGADFNFRRINVINPKKHLATPYGGLIWTSYGAKGNGSNGYIDTNYNAATDGVKFELNNAHFGGYVFDFDATQVGDYSNILCGITTNEEQSIYLSNSVNQKINTIRVISLKTNAAFKKTVTLNRNNSENSYLLANNEAQNQGSQSSIIRSSTTVLFRDTKRFSKNHLSTFHQGAALTLEENNQLDTLVDNYLKSINLNPIT